MQVAASSGAERAYLDLGAPRANPQGTYMQKGVFLRRGGSRRRDEQGVNEDRTVYFFEFGVYFQLLLRDERAVYFLENVV